jgi:hypothetical protein
LGWAVVHAQALEKEIRRFKGNLGRQPIVTTEARYEPHRHAFSIQVTSVRPVLPGEWCLMLGDIANNYRASLDHLAWALVERGKSPPSTLKPRQQRSIAFPIARDNSLFNESLRSLLPGVRRADIAKVRRFQPYNRGQRRRPFQCLSILAWFNNLDKHRTIQPVYGLPVNARHKRVEAHDCIVRRGGFRGRSVPLEVGAEIGTLRVKKTGPHPQLDMEISLTAEITLENRVAVIEWMNVTRVWISALLKTFDDASQRP